MMATYGYQLLLLLFVQLDTTLVRACVRVRMCGFVSVSARTRVCVCVCARARVCVQLLVRGRSVSECVRVGGCARARACVCG